jgi:hypothetical protein
VVTPLGNHGTRPSTTMISPNNAGPYVAKGSETGIETRSTKPYQNGGRMPIEERVTPRRTLSIARGNAIQIGGLLGAAALAWYAGREGFGARTFGREHGSRAGSLRTSRSMPSPTGWSGGPWASALPGTAARHEPPAELPAWRARWVFSRLPFLNAPSDPTSLGVAKPRARAAMWAAGTVGTVVASVAIPSSAWHRGVRGARGFFLGAGPWSVPLLLSESLRPGGGPAPGVAGASEVDATHHGHHSMGGMLPPRLPRSRTSRSRGRRKRGGR